MSPASRSPLESYQKLAQLTEAARFDAAGPSGLSLPQSGTGAFGLANALDAEGQPIAVLKLLLTSQCVYDCHYCVHRASNPQARVTSTPQEVADWTLGLYRQGWIDGLFLSSGIVSDPDTTLQQLLQTVRILRDLYAFEGFVHLVIPPGAHPNLIEEAAIWADRLSVNLELESPQALQALAPQKAPASIESVFRSLPHPQQSTTQLLVGATAATDRQILREAARLYRQYDLQQVHYTAYVPVQGAAPGLPSRPPSPLRLQRLEQADRLLRQCGFEPDELTTPDQPNLPLDIEPKLAWALRQRHLFPVDIARAPQELLLRVPGIERSSLSALLDLRRRQPIHLADLVRLGIDLPSAQPFVLTAEHSVPNHRPTRVPASRPQQLGLF